MKQKLKNKDNPFLKFAIKSYSHVLCSTALEHLAVKPVSKLGSSDRAIELYNRFIELVQRDFRNHRTIMYYADKLNITPKYFSKLIKKVSGKSAGEWDAHRVTTRLQTDDRTINNFAAVIYVISQSY